MDEGPVPLATQAIAERHVNTLTKVEIVPTSAVEIVQHLAVQVCEVAQLDQVYTIADIQDQIAEEHLGKATINIEERPRIS